MGKVCSTHLLPEVMLVQKESGGKKLLVEALNSEIECKYCCIKAVYDVRPTS